MRCYFILIYSHGVVLMLSSLDYKHYRLLLAASPAARLGSAHLSSSRVKLGDGGVGGHQQRADVGPHRHTLRAARRLQLGAAEALQQLQIPHCSLTVYPAKADAHLRRMKQRRFMCNSQSDSYRYRTFVLVHFVFVITMFLYRRSVKWAKNQTQPRYFIFMRIDWLEKV